MRDAFAQTITELARQDDRLVLLSGDIGNRMFDRFKQDQPARFYNCGVAEANMLGVAAAYRGTGLGRRLKLEQRQRTLAMGLNLMEWTYDPLQDLNAFLNFERLGVIVEEYHLNVYGESTSVLHRGAPTDRFIAQWRLDCPRVRRLAAGNGEPDGAAGGADAPATPVIETSPAGEWLAPARLSLGCSEPALDVAVPGGFSEMLSRDAGLALAWRLATREVFSHYLGRGYAVVAFRRDPRGGGRYRLETSLPADVTG